MWVCVIYALLYAFYALLYAWYVTSCDAHSAGSASSLFHYTLPNLPNSPTAFFGALNASLAMQHVPAIDHAVPQHLTVDLLLRARMARLHLRLPRHLRSSSCFRNQRQPQLESRTAQLGSRWLLIFTAGGIAAAAAVHHQLDCLHHRLVAMGIPAAIWQLQPCQVQPSVSLST